MDIWLFGCLVMVFLSLIEFTMAQSCDRKPNKVRSSHPLKRNFSQVFNEKNNPSPAWTQNNDSDKPSSSPDTVQTTTRMGYVSTASSRVEGHSIHSHWAHIFKVFQHVERKKENLEMPVEERDNALDRASRYLFPSVMMIFIVTYCAYYSSRESAKSAEKSFSVKGITN